MQRQRTNASRSRPLDGLKVELQLETRGSDHSDCVVAALRDASYPVALG